MVLLVWLLKRSAWGLCVAGKGMKTVIKADKHEMTLDEPKSVGGTDEGPSPFHAVLGALAGCEQATGKRPETYSAAPGRA